MATTEFHVKEGDRVRLLFMPDDPDPIPVGTEGTVRDVQEFKWNKHETQINVKWDNGRGLSCICPPDIVEVISTRKND